MISQIAGGNGCTHRQSKGVKAFVAELDKRKVQYIHRGVFIVISISTQGLWNSGYNLSKNKARIVRFRWLAWIV